MGAVYELHYTSCCLYFFLGAQLVYCWNPLKRFLSQAVRCQMLGRGRPGAVVLKMPCFSFLVSRMYSSKIRSVTGAFLLH